MDPNLTQLGVGGIFAVVLIDRVFNFIRNRNGNSNSNGNGNGNYARNTLKEIKEDFQDHIKEEDKKSIKIMTKLILMQERDQDFQSIIINLNKEIITELKEIKQGLNRV